MNTSLPQNHLCNVTLLGNLVNTPVIRYQANPVIAVAEFTVATHSRWLDKKSNEYKQWTSYHVVKMIGDVVERSLLNAQQGDIVLIQGHLVDSKKSGRALLHATYAHVYPKGYTRSVNQIHCSGKLVSEAKLVQTANNKDLLECTIAIDFYNYSAVTQQLRRITIERKIHLWGKQALYLSTHSQIGDELIVDGKISYFNDKDKSQFIEAHQVVLQKEG